MLDVFGVQHERGRAQHHGINSVAHGTQHQAHSTQHNTRRNTPPQQLDTQHQNMAQHETSTNEKCLEGPNRDALVI
jgi:hypothetical protein